MKKYSTKRIIIATCSLLISLLVAFIIYMAIAAAFKGWVLLVVPVLIFVVFLCWRVLYRWLLQTVEKIQNGGNK